MPKRILDDKTKRAAKTFHKLYLAVYRAHREAPDIFTDQECNRILTAVMGAKWFSWKVIGITEAALRAYADFDFRYKSGSGLARAHRIPRIETVRKLLRKKSPLKPDEFMKFWIKNDATIICAKGENKAELPPYIPILNEEGKLFGCDGRLAGWHHRKREREFLMQLHLDYGSKRTRSARD